MRASQWFLTTKKETPSDAELPSHQLMLRAGMIHKLGSGLYTIMPLGFKVLRKIETIVREEMNRVHAIELLMPAIQPAELWQETGRWDTFGGQLLTMHDSNHRAYCFGPTHEEVVTDIMRHELQSYKQLPVTVYQIQTKFRDEIRPRFGMMRAREFIMKDAYSFHLTQESLASTYQRIYDAYARILNRLGLKYRAVEADTGAIGGSASHEFQVLADSGEDLIFYCDASQYAANVEQATSFIPEKAYSLTNEPLQTVATINKKTINEVADYLQVATSQLVKTLIVQGKDNQLVALVLKGDDELNTVKAAKHPLIDSPLQLVDEQKILDYLQLPVGSIGPVALGIPVIVDHHARALSSFICGANQAEKHHLNATWDTHVIEYELFDLRMVKEGDLSPNGQGKLRSCRGIEVGHVFQLGNKYAQAMNAQVINEQGQLQTMLMGCYGLGISRIMAAAIEQHHDDKGMIWPQAIAPFQGVIIPINGHKSSLVMQRAQALYQQCISLGLDMLFDDRNERPGVLFADSELIGIPHRFVISERHLNNNCVEYKARTAAQSQTIALDSLVEFIINLVRTQEV